MISAFLTVFLVGTVIDIQVMPSLWECLDKGKEIVQVNPEVEVTCELRRSIT